MATKKPQKKKKQKKPNPLAKIGHGLYSVFSKIYSIIDKIIITPVAKFILWLSGLFKNTNTVFDRILNIKSVLIVLSLVIAIVIFLNYDNAANRLRNDAADILYNQKVTALYNEEAYVIEGLPKTVDITIIGRRADLYLAKQYADEDVEIDLRDLKPGTHKVKLKHTGSVNSVDYKLDPSTATVIVYEKISESKKISKEILYEDKLDSKYTIQDIKFSRDEVYVKGPQYKLDQIATVKALVDVRKINNPSVGTTTLKEIPLVAYDEKGKKLDVEIVPGTIDALVEIASPSKEVPLKVIPSGEVVFGKAIDEIKLNKTKATIYSDEATLEKISYIPVNINVSGITKETEYTVNLSLPSGVRDISTKTVIAKVTLDDVKEKTIKNVNIATKNLENGLTAQAASKDDSIASVIVKGSANNIKEASIENISAYVDLQGLGKGTHKVKVEVTGEDSKLSYTPKTKTITIIIK